VPDDQLSQYVNNTVAVLRMIEVSLRGPDGMTVRTGTKVTLQKGSASTMGTLKSFTAR